MKKILLIEDDQNILELINIHLRDLNYFIKKTSSGKAGLIEALATEFDLIILDLNLPDINGFEVCRKLRSNSIYTPVMMLTARSEESDKVAGFESGADDYITKPFGIPEFLARVKAILRRSEINRTKTLIDEQLVCGDLVVDLQKRKVTLKEIKLELTPKEFDLLFLFISNPGKSFSREMLLNKIWGYEFSGYEHTVNSHINRLRTKIEPDLSNPTYILTHWGIGYGFTEQIKTYGRK